VDGVSASSDSAAAEGRVRRTAEAAASEGPRRRKPRREAAQAETLRRGEEEAVVAAVRGLQLPPRQERGEKRLGLKAAAAGLSDGARDDIARGRWNCSCSLAGVRTGTLRADVKGEDAG